MAATLLFPRVAVAKAALAALEVEESADAGSLEVAAELAETAGDHARAMDFLVAAAAAALRQGALSSASALAEGVVEAAPVRR